MKKIALISTLLFSVICWGQLANDCTAAIVVCGNSQIESNATGFGRQELDNETNPCSFEEVNSLWFKLNIAITGTLEFELTPNNPDLGVDYDFYIFGPNFGCGNFTDPIRCSTTNPENASLTYNTTGLSDSENDDSEGPGGDGNGYVSALNVVAGESYFLLVDRPHGGGGFSLDWTGTADFNEFQPVGDPEDIILCLATSETAVDLTINNTLLTSDPDLKIRYYSSLAGVYDGTDVITNPESFLLPSAMTDVFVKVSSPNGCFEVKQFSVIADEYLDSSQLVYAQCDQDNDGSEVFDLLELETDVVDLFSDPMQFSNGFYTAETDAENQVNPITLAANYNSTQAIIYVRIDNVNQTDCYTILPIDLDVVSSPIISTLSLVQCDVDESNSRDGITSFNLEQIYLDIPDSENYDFEFFRTQGDLNNSRPIYDIIGFRNTIPFNQTLYYEATNSEFSCASQGQIELVVQSTAASLTQQGPFYLCENGDLSGELLGTFDLTEIANENFTGLDVTFYESLVDVTFEQFHIEGNYTSGTETIYARIENLNQCQDVQEIKLIVIPVPTFDFPENYKLCTDGSNLIVNAPDGFDSYFWFKSTGRDEQQQIGQGDHLEVSEPGNYILEVGSTFTVDGETSSCSKQIRFLVSPSSRATFKNIAIDNDLANNSVQIEVAGQGIYEYSLDGFQYQDENFFTNLEGGIQTIYVRDKYGCGVVEEDISIIGFPKFFTPNGDGVNEFWNLIGVPEEQEISVFIYDRYGKLVYHLGQNNSQGWNGTFNGNRLPASDYWFRVNLEEGRIFNGHFTLKR